MKKHLTTSKQPSSLKSSSYDMSVRLDAEIIAGCLSGEIETMEANGTFVEFICARTEDETLTSWELQWIVLTSHPHVDWKIDGITRLITFTCGTRLYNFKTTQIGNNAYNIYYYMPLLGENKR